MQDTVQYNNSVVGFQTALARQEGLCSRLPILTFQCQKICVCFWCGAAKRRHFFAVITVSEPVHEAVRKILPLVGKRIRTEQGCCGSGLLLIKAFRLRREAHQLIEKVTKLVDGGPRRGYRDWLPQYSSYSALHSALRGIHSQWCTATLFPQMPAGSAPGSFEVPADSCSDGRPLYCSEGSSSEWAAAQR